LGNAGGKVKKHHITACQCSRRSGGSIAEMGGPWSKRTGSAKSMRITDGFIEDGLGMGAGKKVKLWGRTRRTTLKERKGKKEEKMLGLKSNKKGAG